MNWRNWMLRLLLINLMCLTMSAQATPFIFGDSLSDAGNVWNASKADPNLEDDPIVPPFYQGRMSNGKNWADYVSDDLGYGSISASSIGGTNYAWAGATTANGITIRRSLLHQGQTQPVDNVGEQISKFQTDHGSFASNDLVLYWSGSNDILYYALNAAMGGGLSVSEAISHLTTLTQNNLVTLEALGATRIVLPNQINAANAPVWSGLYGLPAAMQQYVTDVTLGFNAKLAALISQLEGMAGFDADIIDVDAYTLAENIFANPTAYGFTNVTDPAFPAFIANANQHLFWDPIHPTTVAHRLIADEVKAQLVPEPSILLLSAAGMAAAGITTRRRRRIKR